MIYVLGDLHIRKEEPFFFAASAVLEKLKEELSKGDTLIQIGDLFHTSKPFPKEYGLILDFLSHCKVEGIEVILLAGNHDYNHNQKTYSIDPLLSGGVQNIYAPLCLEIENSTFFFLPWQPIANFKESIEKEYPEKFRKEIEKSDFLVYHFPDETIMFGSDYQGIDLRAYEKINPNIQRLGGDIHKPDANYLGTPYQTRYDEKDQVGRFGQIEKSKLDYIEFSSPTSFVDIEYGEEINTLGNEVPILTIKNSPSVEIAREKYKDCFIRLIETTTSMERIEGEEKELSSLPEALSEFLTINKVDKKTSVYLKETLSL